MSTLYTVFFGGVIVVGFIFTAGKGRGSYRFLSENRTEHEHHDGLHKIEQEVQQVKDRALLWDLPY